MKYLQKQARKSVHDISITAHNASNEQHLKTLKELPKRSTAKRGYAIENNVGVSSKESEIFPSSKHTTKHIEEGEHKNDTHDLVSTKDDNYSEGFSIGEDSLTALEEALRAVYEVRKSQYEGLRKKITREKSSLLNDSSTDYNRQIDPQMDDFLWMDDHKLSSNVHIKSDESAKTGPTSNSSTRMKLFFDSMTVKNQSAWG
ncbi:hypothetical protein XU18_1979 [Perkinsela sp. CCAP 1560/4]|nr:hypothetical protein XU18_1979 [Perkinsela sp. CCAP 1560/4]|eukprot:KNH07447.1 hypothetical protein XU18_1979 [Perkinsela sp. CCAP 1560/4]